MKTNKIKLETPFIFTQEQLNGVKMETKDEIINPKTLIVKHATKVDGGMRTTLVNAAGDTTVLTSFPIELEKGDILNVTDMTVTEIKRPVAEVAPPEEPGRSPTSGSIKRQERSLF